MAKKGKKNKKKDKEEEQTASSFVFGPVINGARAAYNVATVGRDTIEDGYNTLSQAAQAIRMVNEIQNAETAMGVVRGMSEFQRATTGAVRSGASFVSNVRELADHLSNLSHVLIGEDVIPGWASQFVNTLSFMKMAWEQNKDLWAARGLLDGLKGTSSVLKNIFDRVNRNVNHFGLTVVDGATLKTAKKYRKGAWYISELGDLILKKGTTLRKAYGRYLLDHPIKNRERFLKIESIAMDRNSRLKRKKKKSIKYRDGEDNIYIISKDGIVIKIHDAKLGKDVYEPVKGIVPQLYDLKQHVDEYTKYYYKLQDLFLELSRALAPGSDLNTVMAIQLESDYHDLISHILTGEQKMAYKKFAQNFYSLLELGMEPEELLNLLISNPADIQLNKEAQELFNFLKKLQSGESINEETQQIFNYSYPDIRNNYFSGTELIHELGNTYMTRLNEFRPTLRQDIGTQAFVDTLLLGGTLLNTLLNRGMLTWALGVITIPALKWLLNAPAKFLGFNNKEREENNRRIDELNEALENALEICQEVLRRFEAIHELHLDYLSKLETLETEVRNMKVHDFPERPYTPIEEEEWTDAKENSNSIEEDWFSADEYVPEPEPKKIKMDDGAEEYGEPFSNGFESQPLETNPSNIANLTEQDNQDINNELQQLEGEVIVSDSSVEEETDDEKGRLIDWEGSDLDETLVDEETDSEKGRLIDWEGSDLDEVLVNEDEAKRPEAIPEDYDKYDWRWFENKTTNWIRSKLKTLKDPKKKEIYRQELKRREKEGVAPRPAPAPAPEPTIPITNNESQETVKPTNGTNVPENSPSFREWFPRRAEDVATPGFFEAFGRNVGYNMNGPRAYNYPRREFENVVTDFALGVHNHVPINDLIYGGSHLPALTDERWEISDFEQIEENATDDYVSQRQLIEIPTKEPPPSPEHFSQPDPSPEPNFNATRQVDMPIVNFAGANPDPNDPSSDSSSDSDDNHNFNDDNDFSDNDNEFDADDDLRSIGDRSGDELNVDDVDEANINEFNALNPLPNVVDVNIDPNEMGMRLEDFEVVPRLANDRMNHFIDAVSRESGLPRWMVERVVIRIGDVPNPQTIIKVINGAKLAGNVISGALAVYDIVKAINRMKARRQYKKFLDNVKKETERRLNEDVFNENGKRKRPTEKSSVELITEMSQEMQDWMRDLPDKTRSEIFDAILKNKDNFKIAQDLFYQTRGYGKVNKTILKNELNTSLQGGRSLGYVPQIFSSSYLERVFKAKMANTLPVDQTEQSSVIIKEDPIQEKLDTTILEAPAEDAPGHFEVTRVDDQAIYVKPVIEANALSDKVLDEDNVPDKVLEKTQEDDFDLPEAAVSVQTVNVAPAEPLVNNSNLIQDDSFDMTLLKVKGNPKVRRCSKCNTFVSLDKTHSARECADRLAKFKASRGKKRSHRRKGKKGDVVLTKAQAKKLLKAKKKIPSALKKLLQKSLK